MDVRCDLPSFLWILYGLPDAQCVHECKESSSVPGHPTCGLIMARKLASSRGTVTTILCRGLVLLETLLSVVVVGKFLNIPLMLL